MLDKSRLGRLGGLKGGPARRDALVIIGAVGRLTDAGMDVSDATDTVLRILRETQGESDNRERP